jgi:putative SOS response-associated peptidase YedK
VWQICFGLGSTSLSTQTNTGLMTLQRPSQIRRMLQDNDMPVWDAPEDDGDGAPRQSYNFAPGYHGVVYRADVPDYGAGPRRRHNAGPSSSQGAQDDAEQAPPSAAEESADETEDEGPKETHYILQSMKWGLVPFWTKRNPDYASIMRTINCRDDSLSSPGGMWASMKGRKRCIVVAQGFFEWLAKGPRDKVPHYIRRRDGGLLLMAGLWDCVTYEDDEEARRNYTYTIITTDSNKQLKFLHDRMPVILEPGSAALRAWLDPGRYEWSRELQALLRPWDGELDIDVVSKEVNKVGNSSASLSECISEPHLKVFLGGDCQRRSSQSSPWPARKTSPTSPTSSPTQRLRRRREAKRRSSKSRSRTRRRVRRR